MTWATQPPFYHEELERGQNTRTHKLEYTIHTEGAEKGVRLRTVSVRTLKVPTQWRETDSPQICTYKTHTHLKTFTDTVNVFKCAHLMLTAGI